MRDFLKQHRQKFLTEDYYLKRKQLYQDTLHDYLNNSQFYTSEFQTYDYFKVHKQPEWDVIAGYYLKFLYLEYTAGQDIASLKKYLYQFIEYKEKECQAIVDYANTEQRPALLVDLYDTDSIFNVIGLAYLLDCRDLLARIEPMLQRYIK